MNMPCDAADGDYLCIDLCIVYNILLEYYRLHNVMHAYIHIIIT